MRQFKSYAPPSFWGKWEIIGSHLGEVSFKITAEAVGSTLLRCKVRYYKTSTQQVVEEWLDSKKIECGNCVANVEVCFMGNPLGTAVDGTINP
jgi:hypothetical protein